MPEPITLALIGGVVLLLKNKPNTAHGKPLGTITGGGGVPLGSAASGTHPTAPLATHSSIVNGALVNAPNAVSLPSNLAAVLDDQTAVLMRQYAAANPTDFQNWLNHYAAHIQLRDDYYFHAVTNPPPQGGYQLTPQMGISLGAAAYKVAQALNGVAAGQNVDVFGVTATVVGRIPDVNPDFVKAMQGLALGYRAFTAALTIADIGTIAAANGVGILDVTANMLTSGVATSVDEFGNLIITETPVVSGQFAMAPIASFAGILMAAGLCIDIAFTIAGNEPDMQKAIDVALDVAALVCLFIPVVGWVIAIVIELVKFIIDAFGGDLFGGGLTHNQRQQLEAAAYGQNLNPMFPQIAQSYTPRELYRTLVEWGSGYCGGAHVIAIAVSMTLKKGNVLTVGGKPYMVPADTTLPFGRQPCYWLASTPFAAMTDDEQAWALGRYASENGVVAEAQVGIDEAMKAQFNVPTDNIFAARAAPMGTMIKKGVTLDQFDTYAKEYRAQPALNATATAFGWAKWQDMLGDVVGVEWYRWAGAFPHGTLSDFAKANGYPSMFEFRTAALLSYQRYVDRLHAASQKIGDTLNGVAASWLGYNMAASASPASSAP